MKTLAILFGAVAAASGAGSGDEDENSPERFFESKVRPLLAARCFSCHSPEGGGKVKGGLRLDSRETVLKGGNQGPAVVPGDPAGSLLLRAVSYADPDLKMPPKERLPRGEVEILERWIRMGAPWSAAPPSAPPRARPEKEITSRDREFWSFRPPRDPAPPEVRSPGLCRNPVDRFIQARLETEGLTPAPEADRRTLIRRLTYDLHGLPPTPEEVEAFERDPAPDAYERLVDRLLADPRYGERWARFWLDLVRYAESDGHRQDAYRPHAWRYRDYVVRAFNEDKPYDRFILEQLAGDEIAPDDPSILVATGYLRLGMYEYNQRDVPRQWADILNDLTDVTADVFLGLGMGCARCHDHKFDPLLQKDYYALQAFFAAVLWRDDLSLAAPREREAYRTARAAWEEKTAAVRADMAVLERPYLERAAQAATAKFPPETQEILRKPEAARTPYERQIAALAERQILYEQSLIDGKIKGPDRERWSALKRRLADFDAFRPDPLPPAFAATDVGPEAPPTRIPGHPARGPIAPAFPQVLGFPPPDIVPVGKTSTGRRTALARWLARPDHPLTARVMMNRLWQRVFRRGLVATSSDFGRLGEAPSHPELLDWLACRFVESGWLVKSMHRLLLTSAAYRRSSIHPDPGPGRRKDPQNRWLWRATPRRLEAEEVRDAFLAVAGELDGAAGGPSADATGSRRTIYTKVLRNTRDPLLQVFDAPDAFTSVPERLSTTTAPQALLLMNGAWVLRRAEAFAARLRRLPLEERVAAAYRLAFGREPGSEERRRAEEFLSRGRARGEGRNAPGDPILEPTPQRGGLSVRIRGNHPEDRLRLPAESGLHALDFSVEAVVLLDSLHEDASVRVIASQWAGREDRPGWSFGVTGKKSRHEPRNLVLQIVGPEGYEVIPSDLRMELHRLHYAAFTLGINAAGEPVATFHLKDLSDPDAPMRTAVVRRRNAGPLRPAAALVVGGRDGVAGHGWDGLVDELRLSRGPFAPGQLLEGDARGEVLAHWRFEAQPGPREDASGRQPPLSGGAGRDAGEARDEALADFCHVLLTCGEFFHVD
ncbi:MAG: PSD1 and planctomycete cytochrome C domain-containing protein [Planctomycetota bacterium]